MFSIQTKYIEATKAWSIGFSFPSIVKMINHYSLVFQDENNNSPSWVTVQMAVPARHLFIDPFCHPRRVQHDNNSDNSRRPHQRYSSSSERKSDGNSENTCLFHIQPKWIFWKVLLFFSTNSTCRLCPCGYCMSNYVFTCYLIYMSWGATSVFRFIYLTSLWHFMWTLVCSKFLIFVKFSHYLYTCASDHTSLICSSRWINYTIHKTEHWFPRQNVEKQNNFGDEMCLWWFNYL